MAEGYKAFQQGKFIQALSCFYNAVNVAESTLQLAEAFHSLALTHLKIGNTSKFFECEKLSAKYYESIDLGQSADLMKSAGDILLRLKEKELANVAYLLAAKYFNEQSMVEEEIDLMLAWKGWSHFCYGKSGNDPVTNFKKAAEYFSQAASNSTSEALKNNRMAKAYFATALAIIFDPNLNLTEKIIESKKNFEKALSLDMNNPFYKSCLLITDILLLLIRFQASKVDISSSSEEILKKVTILKETLNLIEKASILIEELDETIKNIQSKSTFNAKILDTLFEMLKAVA
jgi:tetratricopeptide (TPR) repeat protein